MNRDWHPSHHSYIAEGQGINAATRGEPYDSNPWNQTTHPEAHLAWSKGHNGMRAKLALEAETA